VSKRLALVGAVLVGSACATGQVALDDGARARLRGAEMRAVHHESTFTVRVPSGGLFGGGVVGAVASETVAGGRGEAMREQYGLADPALRVAGKLGQDLRASFGVARVDVVAQPVAQDEPGGSGLTLDVRTDQWLLLYFPTDWSHYRVAYRARARLLEGPDTRVLWQSSCEVMGSDLSASPTLEELEANGAALLREKLGEVGDECARQLATALAGGER
jgi:hypothetical protein